MYGFCMDILFKTCYMRMNIFFHIFFRLKIVFLTLKKGKEFVATLLFYNVIIEYKIIINVIRYLYPDDPELIDVFKLQCIEILATKTFALSLLTTVIIKNATALKQ